MKKYILSIVETLLRKKRYFKYSRRFRTLLAEQHIVNRKAPGEDDYVAFWKQISPCVEPYSYRFYRSFCGDSKYIVPEDIGHSFIETRLNPIRYTPYYEDKNMLPVILPAGSVSPTILCRMHGGTIMSGDFTPLSDNELLTDVGLSKIARVDELILKPSIDSNSGNGVTKFILRDNKYLSSDGTHVLDGKYLLQYGKDWVLQEAIHQHSIMNQFCSTAVNTIRVNMYRSVVDEQVYVVSAALRIAKNGSIVDNGHAGGGLVHVDLVTGELGHEVVNQRGDRFPIFNGVDFLAQTYRLPDWVKIKDFCRNIATYNHHCRLIALDVALKKDGHPILIEWNIAPYSFSYWIPMLTGVVPFGDKTEEIVKYCVQCNV